MARLGLFAVYVLYVLRLWHHQFLVFALGLLLVLSLWTGNAFIEKGRYTTQCDAVDSPASFWSGIALQLIFLVFILTHPDFRLGLRGH